MHKALQSGALQSGLGALLVPVAAIGLSAGAAFAADPPPNALPMSELTLRIENTFSNFSGFKKIEWDDDGYWDMELLTLAGEKVDARVDPVNGTVTLEK